jgi:hypothetical protein
MPRIQEQADDGGVSRSSMGRLTSRNSNKLQIERWLDEFNVSRAWGRLLYEELASCDTLIAFISLLDRTFGSLTKPNLRHFTSPGRR